MKKELEDAKKAIVQRQEKAIREKVLEELQPEHCERLAKLAKQQKEAFDQHTYVEVIDD